MDDGIQRRKRNVATACAAAVVTWICLFSHLGAIGLVGPDEPRYAWIARAMAQTGDWVTPRLHGSPWFEKPILYYWLAGITFGLHFPPEWAARLPSACAALVAAVSVGWVAWRFEGADEDGVLRDFCLLNPAVLAPLIFSASVAAIGFARAATPDMLFSASLTLAMAAAAAVLRDSGALGDPGGTSLVPGNRHSMGALAAFGAFVGLAVLAKGPAGVVLAGGAVFIWSLVTRHWRAAFRLLDPVAVIAFCAVALPWYLLCALRNPEFVHVFIFEHNFERYLTPIFQHRQPFWFFVPITLLAILPWTVFLIPATSEGMRLSSERVWRRSPGFFFACWAFFPILFFSFSQSKLPGYVLPAIPPLALVLAIAISRMIEGWGKAGSAIIALCGITWLGLATGGWIWLRRLPAGAAATCRTAVAAGSFIAVVGAAAILLLCASRRCATVWISLALTCVMVELAGFSVLPNLGPYFSARAVGTMLRADERPDRLFVYELPRGWQYGLAFYLDRQLREWSPDDFDAALVLTTPQGAADLKNSGFVLEGIVEPYHTVLLVPIPARPHPPRTP